MRSAPAVVAALAATVLIAAPVAGAAPKPFTYGVIGDTPYGQPQVDNLPDDVAEINADREVRLVVHLGDIKNGSTECSTSYFEKIRADVDAFAFPLVYTPGDNEWTDCHRTNNGGYWPAGKVLNADTRPARLDEVRRIFFPEPGRTLGAPKKVDAQDAPYVENVRWSRSDVEFGTLHVVGSNNDWAPWFGKPRTWPQLDEVTQRTAADVAWLGRIFDIAKKRDAKGVVLAIQADVWDPAIVGDPASYDHFTPFVQALAARSLAFAGPVLLLDGDSHVFTDDHPLADPAHPQNKAIYGIEEDVPNLRRITVNGSTTPCHEWLKLEVDASAADPFAYERVKFAKQPGFDPVACPAVP